MMIKEVKILSEGLWESVKTDLKFFSPIQLFVKRLSELSFLKSSDVDEATIYVDKIEEFFDKYRSTSSDSLYFPPALISNNDESVAKIRLLIYKLRKLSEEDLKKELESIEVKSVSKSKSAGKIFIGHGRSKLWARVQLFIKEDLGLPTLVFEDESRTGETIVNILAQFLDQASFAILIMTAEDETAEGKIRARQNVIHEAGLFQGRLGFEKVIILKQNNIEEFSNIAGLQYIPFSSDNIEQTFYEIQRKLKKAGILN
ncbi:TIR domain-containing protein [Larkinella sp. VNQ87]|uniref:TIR domain-containing protein n=1 Tax=Larkinella sp. VNQ87 TaxID=3400921 RepID=UPI003C094DD4